MGLRKKILSLVRSQKGAGDQLMLGYASETHVVALFTLLGILAGSNKEVTRAELDQTTRFIVLQVPDPLRTLATESFAKGKELYPSRGLITRYAFTLYWEPTTRWLEPLQVLDILLRLAFADGDLSEWEESIIDSVRLTLGIHIRTYLIIRDTIAERLNIRIRDQKVSFVDAKDWNRFERLKSRTQTIQPPASRGETTTKRDHAFKVLNLPAEATAKDIRDAYRRLVKAYHPDAQQSSGVSDAEAIQAVERFLEVQEAYEVLMNADSL